MLVPFEEVDYLSQARDRITYQFRDKPIIDKYLQLLCHPAIQLQLVLKDLMQKRDIDTAEGAQLDIIGEIVGQPRSLSKADLFPFFGFDEDFSAETFGTLADPEVGGLWYSLGQPTGGNVILSDDNYRLMIKSKIVKNRSAATPEDFLYFCSFVFGAGSVEIEELSALVKVYFQRDLSKFEKYLLQYTDKVGEYRSPFMLKTIGVSMEYYDKYGELIPAITTEEQ